MDAREGVSQTLPLENGCVRPDVRTSRRTLRKENEGVFMLLGDVYLVWETHGFTRFLHGAGVNQETFYMVDYYQEFRYTSPVVVVFGLGLVGPRVYG